MSHCLASMSRWLVGSSSSRRSLPGEQDPRELDPPALAAGERGDRQVEAVGARARARPRCAGPRSRRRSRPRCGTRLRRRCSDARSAPTRRRPCGGGALRAARRPGGAPRQFVLLDVRRAFGVLEVLGEKVVSIAAVDDRGRQLGKVSGVASIPVSCVLTSCVTIDVELLRPRPSVSRRPSAAALREPFHLPHRWRSRALPARSQRRCGAVLRRLRRGLAGEPWVLPR